MRMAPLGSALSSKMRFEDSAILPTAGSTGFKYGAGTNDEACRGGLAFSQLKRQQVLHQVILLLIGQAQALDLVVVVHDVEQSRKPPVVVEASLLVRPEASQRRCPVSFVRRALGLEIVNPDLGWRVHIPTGLGKQRRHMAGGALRFAVEDRLPTRSRATVKAACWRRGRRYRELIKVKRGELRGDQVRGIPHITEAVCRGYRKLSGVVQPWVEKRPFAMSDCQREMFLDARRTSFALSYVSTFIVGGFL